MRKLIKDNAPEVIRILLNELKVKYTNATVDRLKANPYFPDLISISHTLANLGIDNGALKASYEELEQLPTPFVVHLHDNGGMYLVAKEINKDHITFAIEGNQSEVQDSEEFKKSFSGFVLVLDNEQTGVKEQNYATNNTRQLLQNTRLPLLVLALMALAFLFFRHDINNPLLMGFKALSLAGIAASVLLLVQYIDKNNPFVKNICNNKTNKKVNCSSILNSKEGKFFGLISWSEVGFIYFCSQITVFALFANFSANALAALSLLAFPYTFYSIYYQWKIAKTWCRLCLMVQAVLFLQAIVGGMLLLNTQVFLVDGWINSLLLMLIVPVFFLILSSYVLPLALELNQKREQLSQSNKVKMQPEIFHSQLAQSFNIKTEAILPTALTYGNKEAENHLLVVINPTCEPCILNHQRISQMARYNENLLVHEVFLVEKENPVSYNLAIKMVEIYLAESENYFKKAISDYYENYTNRGNAWIKKYWKEGFQTPEAETIIEQQVKWALNSGLNSTPVIIYNDFVLPKTYTVNELEYLLY